MRLEDLKHALEVLLLLQLVTAGAEGGTRGVAEGADLLLRLRSEIDEILVQDAEHPVQRPVDFLNAFVI